MFCQFDSHVRIPVVLLERLQDPLLLADLAPSSLALAQRHQLSTLVFCLRSMGDCLPANPSAFCGIFLHLNHVFYIHLKILRNQKFYRKRRDPHYVDVKCVINLRGRYQVRNMICGHSYCISLPWQWCLFVRHH